MDILFVFLLFSIAVTNVKGKESLYDKLKEGVVPDVLDAGNIDSEVLGITVKYPNATVDFGNELTPADTKKEPEVKWTAKTDKFYTLSMTDPDALSRQNPIYREWQHWLVGNIPGHNLKEGENLAAYIGPGPPKGTGPHRYIFLVFEQSEKINFSEPIKGVEDRATRKNFNTREFIKKYNLGNPVFGNYFLAQWDSSVG